MRHFAITSWVDYVRGLADGSRQTAIKRHLDAGCRDCEAMVTAFCRVVAIAAEPHCPPTGAVRAVEAFFAVERLGRRGHHGELPLRSLFDSALAAAPAARRSHGLGRRLLFEADGYTLELSIDRSPDTADGVLRGQLLAAQGEPRSYAPVFLVGAGTVTDRTLTEPSGTFEVGGRLDVPCELWLFPDEEHRIRLPLPLDRRPSLNN